MEDGMRGRSEKGETEGILGKRNGRNKELRMANQ